MNDGQLFDQNTYRVVEKVLLSVCEAHKNTCSSKYCSLVMLCRILLKSIATCTYYVIVKHHYM